MAEEQLLLFPKSLKGLNGRGNVGNPVSATYRGLRAAEPPGPTTASHVLGAIGGVAVDELCRLRTTPRDRRQFFDAMVEEMKTRYGISVRKWRDRMSGVAYELRYRDGTVRRFIAAPRPKSAVSASIFLHEVGHHAVGFRRFRPRCLEEYHVWQWAFEQMRQREIPIDHRVLRHYRRSMYHYVRMAKSRGLKELPAELEQFLQWPG